MTATTVLSYPIPAFQNLPLQPQFYQPSRFVISGVTLGQTTIITTTTNMNYVIGQEVRLNIPPSFGCRQLNGVTAFVVSLPALNEVELALYSLGGDAYQSSTATTQAQILAVGGINNGYQAPNGINNAPLIPGSFTNISPL